MVLILHLASYRTIQVLFQKKALKVNAAMLYLLIFSFLDYFYFLKVFLLYTF